MSPSIDTNVWFTINGSRADGSQVAHAFPTARETLEKLKQLRREGWSQLEVCGAGGQPLDEPQLMRIMNAPS